MSDLEAYSYLWADPAGDWVLLREENNTFSIYNLGGSMLIVEHDDALSAAIWRKMIEAGRQVLDDMPPEAGTSSD